MASWFKRQFRIYVSAFYSDLNSISLFKIWHGAACIISSILMMTPRGGWQSYQQIADGETIHLRENFPDILFSTQNLGYASDFSLISFKAHIVFYGCNSISVPVAQTSKGFISVLRHPEASVVVFTLCFETTMQSVGCGSVFPREWPISNSPWSRQTGI